VVMNFEDVVIAERLLHIRLVWHDGSSSAPRQ
jgi:hypothetical protein